MNGQTFKFLLIGFCENMVKYHEYTNIPNENKSLMSLITILYGLVQPSIEYSKFNTTYHQTRVKTVSWLLIGPLPIILHSDWLKWTTYQALVCDSMTQWQSFLIWHGA